MVLVAGTHTSYGSITKTEILYWDRIRNHRFYATMRQEIFDFKASGEPEAFN